MSLKNTADIFVPGRLCLFGEHSDWAGEYRKTDGSVKTGLCIVAGTDQGVYARAEPADKGFYISQVQPNGSPGNETRYRDAREALAAAKETGNFDSYAAGTASIFMEREDIGLRFSVYRRTLPLKKGLSSSAAVCVATARAFNRVHRLGLGVVQEMDAAYRGELLTGSRCGRMDQVCAFGGGPVLLSFDGNSMETEGIEPGGRLFLLIADLNGKKNTRKILDDLNNCFAQKDPGIRRALGSENHRIVKDACSAVKKGDAESLGSLMTEAQSIFDSLVAPCCAEQLSAPLLHGVLERAIRSGFVWGGKGVGSQGDGTAQFVCRDATARSRLKDLLEGDGRTKCYLLTI